MTLSDIGIRQIGLQRIRFSQCAQCGAVYPHASAMLPSGHGTEQRMTPGPMLNGREITTCPCQQKGGAA